METVQPQASPSASDRTELRARHGVRLITNEEEGTGVLHLPAGVYGFTYSPGAESPLFAMEKYHSFEVHKAQDGSVRIIGYVTPEKAAEMATNNDVLEIQVFPAPWGPSSKLVVIPGDWVVGTPKAPREDGNPVNFRLVAVR
ncbi:MAG TPA: hypothetical protein VE621_20895 [Bryobacteraceae bacterium]|jgi:hypothetical protein|nr:hypothetical protein [Bryobacteraceae bacterium]